MNSKQFLKKIRLYETRIDAKLNEKQHLKDLVTSITTTLKDDAGFGGSGSQDKLGSIVAKMVDLEAEIDADVDSLVDAKKEINDLLDKIDDCDIYEILNKRYVLFETWEQIAFEMHMSYRHVLRLHGKALKIVSVLMEGEPNGE